MKLFFCMLIMCLSLISCVSKRKMTREEWEVVARRTYTDVDKNTLMKAAEKVLQLADGDDFQIGYKPNGFVATRNWFVYAVIAAAAGTDFWTLEVEEKDKTLVASLYISTQAQGMSGYAVGNSAGVVTGPVAGSPIQGTFSYDTFWRRLDFLLGKTTHWADCPSQRLRRDKKEIWGATEHICDPVTLNDDYPDSLSPEEVDRIFKGQDDRLKWKYLKKNDPEKWKELKRQNPYAH